MNRLAWKQLIGQQRVKEVLSGAVARGALGHAYLFCGEVGTGTFQAALELAQALLCESENAPCGECVSCRKVHNYSHEDLHVTMPVELSKEHRSGGDLNQDGWERLGQAVRERILEPYKESAQSGVAQVPVEWMREVMHAVQRGPLGSRACVAIIDGVEQLKKESANTMLKTLEEPPRGSILLLCSSAAHSVLPTILSRCQVLRLGWLSDTEVTQGVRQLRPTADDSAVTAAVEGAQGSLGTALALVDQPHPEAAGHAKQLWGIIEQRDASALVEGVEQLVGALDAGACERMFAACMYLVRNSLVAGCGAESLLPAGTQLLQRDARLAQPRRAQRLLGACRKGIRAVRARTQMMLVILGFIYDIREILDEQE